jgi:hypothetical protein
MPVTKDIIPLHPQGQADRDRFARAIAAFVAGHPVTFINAEAVIGSSTTLFVDPLHLNDEGKRRTTTFIVESLKEPS